MNLFAQTHGAKSRNVSAFHVSGKYFFSTRFSPPRRAIVFIFLFLLFAHSTPINFCILYDYCLSPRRAAVVRDVACRNSAAERPGRESERFSLFGPRTTLDPNFSPPFPFPTIPAAFPTLLCHHLLFRLIYIICFALHLTIADLASCENN